MRKVFIFLFSFPLSKISLKNLTNVNTFVLFSFMIYQTGTDDNLINYYH